MGSKLKYKTTEMVKINMKKSNNITDTYIHLYNNDLNMRFLLNIIKISLNITINTPQYHSGVTTYSEFS